MKKIRRITGLLTLLLVGLSLAGCSGNVGVGVSVGIGTSSVISLVHVVFAAGSGSGVGDDDGDGDRNVRDFALSISEDKADLADAFVSIEV